MLLHGSIAAAGGKPIHPSEFSFFFFTFRFRLMRLSVLFLASRLNELCVRTLVYLRHRVPSLNATKKHLIESEERILLIDQSKNASKHL